MRTPDHPLDELLNAYLDGEASPEERARVEAALTSDPEVAERHRRLLAVAASLEPPVAAPPDVVDAHIVRALAATVVDLEAARRSRRRPMVFAAAAAVAGVFLVGALLATRGGSDDAELADGSPVQTADATTAADASPGAVLEAETASAAATEADGTLNTDPADLRDAGPDEDAGPGEDAGAAAEAAASEELLAEAPDAALAEAVLGLLTSADPAPVHGDAGCSAVTETVPDLVGPVETSGTVTVDGVPLVLYIGAERVAVVDQACAVRVVDRPEG